MKVSENDGVVDEVIDEIRMSLHEVKNIDHQKLKINQEDEWKI